MIDTMTECLRDEHEQPTKGISHPSLRSCSLSSFEIVRDRRPPRRTSSATTTTTTTTTTSMRELALEKQIELLSQQLRDCRLECERKDDIIEQQYNQLLRLQSQIPNDPHIHDQDEAEHQVLEEDPEPKHISLADTKPAEPICETTPESTIDVRETVNRIQRWLFLEGGALRDVPSLIKQYSSFLNSIGIPLDRLLVTGMMLHPQVSAYVWKWERTRTSSTSDNAAVMRDDEYIFFEREVPHEEFAKINMDPKEPFAVLRAGTQKDYRMQGSDDTLPPGCDWFERDGYQDYLALPIIQGGEFKGAMAWSTKAKDGFGEPQIQVFHESLAALSTVLRLYTNDIVLRTLTSRLEDEVQARTTELQTANAQLEKASKEIAEQAQRQLQHFAMMR